MELFAFLCVDQAKELLLSDQKRWLNNRNITQTSGELFEKRFAEDQYFGKYQHFSILI